MKRFYCNCEQPVFFENISCASCGCELGFDPKLIDMVSVSQDADGALHGADGTLYRHCRNRVERGICNWLLPAKKRGDLCLACATSIVIPNLDTVENLRLWGRLEQAKRRLFYSLLTLGLPFERSNYTRPLRFAFLEDQSRNPHVAETYVATGHHDGQITINVAEADDAARHAIREQMREHYRTLLGHFRHEAGPEFFDLFGDWRTDYGAALERYYATDPGVAAASDFISAYASAHPLEDWAEIFAHYLHITETLETAAWALPEIASQDDWLQRWMYLSLRLNELNRSLGAPHPYPFALSNRSIDKLRFIDRRVRQWAAATGRDIPT